MNLTSICLCLLFSLALVLLRDCFFSNSEKVRARRGRWRNSVWRARIPCAPLLLIICVRANAQFWCTGYFP